MLSFFKKLFGSKPVETVAEVPYKVEAPAFPVEAKPAKAKKPAVKKAPAKPRKPKAPK